MVRQAHHERRYEKHTNGGFVGWVKCNVTHQSAGKLSDETGNCGMFDGLR